MYGISGEPHFSRSGVWLEHCPGGADENIVSCIGSPMDVLLAQGISDIVMVEEGWITGLVVSIDVDPDANLTEIVHALDLIGALLRGPESGHEKRHER